MCGIHVVAGGGSTSGAAGGSIPKESYAKRLAASLRPTSKISIGIKELTFTDKGEPAVFFSKKEYERSLKPFEWAAIATCSYGRRSIQEVLNNPLYTRYMEINGPRWKGKNFSAFAQDNPMSKIVEQLQVSLSRVEGNAQLSGCNALLQAGPEVADLLDSACFGRQIVTSDRDAHWFQLGLEEAFYMSHALKCLTILGEDGSPMEGGELWECMKSRQEAFPVLYKAYSHLRSKNWVVRSGTQYGVDFVAYRHHPALVHSEYAVLVITGGGDGDKSSPRLRVWSDLQCTLRVSGSVAKALLVLCMEMSCENQSFPLCLEQSVVEERVIRRWVPEQSRDDG